MSQPAPLADHLAALIARAERFALTPEQVAEDERREARDRRRQVLSVARPAILIEDVQAIVAGTLDPNNPWLVRVRKWLESSTRVLILVGSVGSGKSCAAAWALAECGGYFVAAPDLVAAQESRQQGEWRMLVTTPLLQVDDLGDEKWPADFSAALKLLLSKRAAHGGRTILTTNLPVRSKDPDVETLRGRYPDEKLWSRIAQSFAVCSLNAPDLRPRKS